MKLNRLSIGIALAAAAPSLVFAGEIIPKQLAGPPSEFAQMAEVDPTAGAVHSKAALLPLDAASEKSAGRRALSLPVEQGNFRFLLISPSSDAKAMNLRLNNAKGQAVAMNAGEVQTMDTLFGMGNAQIPARYFDVAGKQTGRFELQFDHSAKSKPTGYVLLEGDANTQLFSSKQKANQFPGQSIGFVTSLFDAELEGADQVKRLAEPRLTQATMRVTDPVSQLSQTYSMFDDGAHNDGFANDGVFGGHFIPQKAGQYVVQVIANGTNARGQAVVRSAEHIVPVVEQAATLQNQSVAGALDANRRINLPLSIQTNKAGLSHVRAYAEVWGRDAQGHDVPVAWIGGMTNAKAGQLNLSLDERWIALANAQAPFELRNVRIEDPNHHVTLSKAERLAVSMPMQKSAIRASEVQMDEAMTMGLRPAGLASQAKGVGSRLLLVHGYCSSDVWPAAQFTNASKFLDLGQNRTNDEFARMIQSFGSTWNSFGIVAHSQGGMAATHLYNYYWSGLDNAIGARLIQSVGTPYKGTNLAGVLAALGSLFGVGCSSNNDLTYSGASAWGSGISTATRAKVNYYTTSFKLGPWYVNDYCNFASDLVLSDPEDGTTEQTYGQFTSAVNRGHVTGQCHTAGMRDPAQYLNATRNATMNTNAAR